MRKKIIIYFSISLFILLLILFVILFFYIDKDVDIDLQTLNKEIIENEDFNNSNTKEIDLEYINNKVGIDSKYIEDFIGIIPLVDISVSQYIVIKTKSKADIEIVYDKLNKYGENLEKTWDKFLLSQQQLVTNRKVGIKGRYAYLIISENAEDIEELINK